MRRRRLSCEQRHMKVKSKRLPASASETIPADPSCHVPPSVSRPLPASSSLAASRSNAEATSSSFLASSRKPCSASGAVKSTERARACSAASRSSAIFACNAFRSICQINRHRPKTFHRPARRRGYSFSDHRLPRTISWNLLQSRIENAEIRATPRFQRRAHRPGVDCRELTGFASTVISL